MFLVTRLVKIIFKRLTCHKHEYKQICKFFGTHSLSGIDVVFSYDYECVKCGKRLTVNMSEDWQIKDWLKETGKYTKNS